MPREDGRALKFPEYEIEQVFTARGWYFVFDSLTAVIPSLMIVCSYGSVISASRRFLGTGGGSERFTASVVGPAYKV